MIFRRIPSEENRSEGNESWQKPDVGNHHANGTLRHIKRIFQRSAYCKISVRRGNFSFTRVVFMRNSCGLGKWLEG